MKPNNSPQSNESFSVSLGDPRSIKRLDAKKNPNDEHAMGHSR